ncbi:MAG: RluA family pseudouridine synthase [Desulfobacteraceae bacterium]|nr:RluA family pseudouridine synthase [Desulfobacteraceae bacterium]
MKIEIEISDELMGERLDQVAAAAAGVTRGRVAAAIKNGLILVSGRVKKPGYRVKPGEIIAGRVESTVEPAAPCAEDLSLDILFEDDHIIVMNKPAGMVVHPAPGNPSGTLVNALLHHCPHLAHPGEKVPERAGIVHRLDKDTSGVLVAAKSRHAFEFLQKEFKQRRVQKQYIALAIGTIREDSGRITLPIGRHPVKRKIMAVNTERARHADTRWRVLERLDGHTLVEVELKTGRTHQIRVHFRALGYPLAGDAVYGFRRKKTMAVPRQMLHARTLGFRHPWSGQRVDFTAPLPMDMTGVLERLAFSNPL